jgi:hypothetical protein
MVDVNVTINVQGKAVDAAAVKDPSVAAALRKMGTDVGRKLKDVRCPKHHRGPTDVRIHVGRNGSGDLKYESCCEELGKAVTLAMG